MPRRRRSAAWLLSLSPPLLVAAWGGWLQASCLLELARYRGPIDTTVPVGRSHVRLLADAFEPHWGQRRLGARGVALRGADGSPIASASDVLVTVGPRGLAPVRVDLRGLRVSLERLPDGRWRNEELLMSERREPSDIPFELRVRSGIVWVRDLARRVPFETAVLIRSASWRSHRDAFAATAEFDAPGLIARAEASGAASGWSLVAEAEDVDVARWLAIVRGGREAELLKPWNGWTMAAGRARGTLRVESSETRAFLFDGELSVRNLVYDRSLAVAEGRFRGTIGSSGAAGRLQAAGRGWSARGDAVFRWSESLAVAWSGAVKARDAMALPPLARRWLPQDLRWREASYEGSMRWLSGEGAYLQGALRSGSLRWTDWAVERFQSTVAADPRVVRLDDAAFRFAGGDCRGDVAVDLLDRAVRGRLVATGLRSANLLGRWVSNPPVRAVARAEVLVRGTVDQPMLDLRLQSYAGLRLGSRWVDLGLVDLAATLKDGVLRLERGSSAGPLGLALASGSYRLSDGKLQGTLFLSGLQGASWLEGLQGYGFSRLEFGGRLRNPQVSGRLEAFGLEFGGFALPFLSADLAWSGDRVALRRFEGLRGTSRIEGEAALALSTGELSGTLVAQGVQLAEWTGDDWTGEVDVLRLELAGSLSDPMVDLSAEASEVLWNGVPLRNLALRGLVDRRRAEVAFLRASLGAGHLEARGNLDWASGIGTAAWSGDAVPLAELGKVLGSEWNLGGSLVVEGGAAFDASGWVALQAKGRLEDATVNGTAAGSGEWEVRGVGPVLSGRLTVGQLERFVEVPEFSLDLDQGAVAARVEALGLPIQDLWSALRRWLAANLPSEDWVARLDQLRGGLTLGARVEGSWAAPDVLLEPLVLDRLALGDEPLGTLRVSGAKRGRTWDLSEVNWLDGPGALVAKATALDDGTIDAQGDLVQFDLSFLQRIGLDVPSIGGRASVSFRAAGKMGDPTIDAAATLEGFGPPGDPWPLSALLTSIRLDAGGLTFEGAVNYGNLTGPVFGSLPFTLQEGWNPGRPLEVGVRFPERDVRDLLPFAPMLDPNRTRGRVSGRFALTGKADEPMMEGVLRADLERLGFTGAATTLERPAIEVSLLSDRLNARVSASGERGGTLEAETEVRFGSVARLFGFGDGDWRLLELSGRLRGEALALAESFGVGGRAKGVVDGDLSLAGTLGRPKIAGRLRGSALDIVAPSEFGEGAAPLELPIEPELAIAFELGPGSKLRAPLAQIEGYGQGRIDGTLSSFRSIGSFTVSGGTLNLPTTRVALDPDGIARLAYVGGLASESEARLDIDLNGRANVTALSPSGLFERYQLQLNFRGDLLSPQGLAINGQSEPPDLSPDRIRAIIGQEDLVRSIEAGNRRALAGYALPVLFDELTEGFARSIGLDFLGLDIGAAGEAALTAVRTLGRGLSVTYRKQVNETAGERTLFDLRLNYRPPRRIVPWRGFSFMVGADQDRPWKLGVEFRRRL